MLTGVNSSMKKSRRGFQMKSVLLSACSEGARESNKRLKVRVSTKGERGAV